MPDELQPPVFIIGAMRSGKTTLAELLGETPGHVTWCEPNGLWRTGHAYRGDDRATAEDARPSVARRMRRICRRYQARHDGRRIIMEGPLGALKIPFLAAAFPASPLVHIVSDGRLAVHAYLKLRATAFHSVRSPKTVARWRMQLWQTPWWEWPSMLPRTVGGYVRSHILRKPVRWVGLRYPGWRNDRGKCSPVEIAARQWAVAVDTALGDLQALSAQRWMQIRLEGCMSDPAGAVERVIDFCGIERSDALVDAARKRFGALAAAVQELTLDEKILAEAGPILEPVLRALGYVE